MTNSSFSTALNPIFKRRKPDLRHIIFSSYSEGSCPVCWGHQQFDWKMRVLYKDKEIDYKNHKNRYVRSLKFQKDNIDGHRKREEIITCPTCGSKNKN